jgi:hypothetical protein
MLETYGYVVRVLTIGDVGSIILFVMSVVERIYEMRLMAVSRCSSVVEQRFCKLTNHFFKSLSPLAAYVFTSWVVFY